MASGPITSWQTDGETMKTVTDFIFLGSKSMQMVTADMKLRCLLLQRKLFHIKYFILKSRDITLLIKVNLLKAMVFLIVMYGCKSRTIKNVEHQRIDAFELWCWRRLLRVPWTARRSNQSILKEISPKYSLEELMLKLQYFGDLLWRTDSLGKTLMLGKTEGRMKRGWQRLRWLEGITDLMDMSLVMDREAWCATCSPWGHKESRQNWATTELNWWTLKTITTESNSPSFPSSLNLVTDTEGATFQPSVLSDINLFRQEMQTRSPRPAPPNKSTELHHLTSRKKWVWMREKWWKISLCGTFSLFLY